MNKILTINYQEVSLEELSPEDASLIDSAKQAACRAYNPYSHFFVGAALKLDNGVIVQGSNQENLAYPSGLCAERTALYYAASQYPTCGMDTLAVIGATMKGEYQAMPQADQLNFCAASPCGSCRQVMAEYELRQGRKIRFLLYQTDSKIVILEGVDSLLPFAFDM